MHGSIARDRAVAVVTEARRAPPRTNWGPVCPRTIHPKIEFLQYRFDRELSLDRLFPMKFSKMNNLGMIISENDED